MEYIRHGGEKNRRKKTVERAEERMGRRDTGEVGGCKKKSKRWKRREGWARQWELEPGGTTAGRKAID